MSPPTITPEEVSRIAALARLGISKGEAAQAAEKLVQILENFSKIQQIDTSQVPPADDVTGKSNVTRSDIPMPETLCSQESLLSAAPATHQRHIKVKAVF